MSPLHKVIVLSCLAALALGLTEDREIEIPNDWPILLQSPYYPDASPDPTVSLKWKLVSSPGSRISIECPDVRISPSDNCEQGYLKITHSGGSTPPYCGLANGLEVTSPDNNMIINFELIWAAGLFECKAKREIVNNPAETIEHPEGEGKPMHLKPGESLRDVITMSPIPPKEKKVWEFTTVPGYKIGIHCPSLWMTKYSLGPECTDGRVVFDLGTSKEEICSNSNDKTLVSPGEKLIVTVESTRRTTGMVQCSVVSTRGPHYEPFKNEPELEEEDSSEYGLISEKGPKDTTCECGWSNKSPARILFGLDVAPHEYPWMAGLMTAKDDAHTYCGGTIVTRRHVISAAHCTVKRAATHVVVGMSHLGKREGGQVVPVEKIVNHGFNKGLVTTKDISILILAEEIKFNKFVGPACLPTRDPNIENKHVVAIGWGNMAPAEYDSKRDAYQLKKAKLRAINMANCDLMYPGTWPTNPPMHICAWHKNRDVCFGDSGGPVVWLDPETNRYTLVGIPSACDGCKLEKPSIHTALHYYYPWILETIRRNYHGDQQVCTKID